MTGIGNLVATLGMNTKPFETAAFRARGTLDKLQIRFSAAMKNIGFSTTTMAIAGVGALAGLGIGFVKLSKDAIAAASKMEETMNKFNVVFGTSATEMSKWSNSFAASIGRSQEQVTNFLASTHDLLVPMGLVEGASRNLSKQVIQLAYDMASLNNAMDEAVLFHIRGALTGEAEAMKKFYGTVVNVKGVMDELISQGWTKKQAQNASNAAKVMARWNIILRGNVKAIGDVKRSQDSYENSTKSLSAAYENLITKLGQMFLPTATAVVQIVEKALGAFKLWYVLLLDAAFAWAKLVQIMTLFQSDRVNKFVEDIRKEIEWMNEPIEDVTVKMKYASIAVETMGESAAAAKKEMSALGKSLKTLFTGDLAALKTTKDKMADVLTFGKPGYQQNALGMLMDGASIENIQRYITASKRLATMQRNQALEKANIARAQGKTNANWASIAAVRRANETPLEKYRRTITEIGRLQKIGLDDKSAERARQQALTEVTKQKRKDKEAKDELPKALMRGSAESWKKIMEAMYGVDKNKPAEETALNTAEMKAILARMENKEVTEASIP